MRSLRLRETREESLGKSLGLGSTIAWGYADLGRSHSTLGYPTRAYCARGMESPQNHHRFLMLTLPILKTRKDCCGTMWFPKRFQHSAPSHQLVVFEWGWPTSEQSIRRNWSTWLNPGEAKKNTRVNPYFLAKPFTCLDFGNQNWSPFQQLALAKSWVNMTWNFKGKTPWIQRLRTHLRGGRGRDGGSIRYI